MKTALGLSPLWLARAPLLGQGPGRKVPALGLARPPVVAARVRLVQKLGPGLLLPVWLVLVAVWSVRLLLVVRLPELQALEQPVRLQPWDRQQLVLRRRLPRLPALPGRRFRLPIARRLI